MKYAMPGITVIAHNIRSTHNIGSIFRTCEGFGVQKLILSGYTPYPKMADDPRLPHVADKLHTQISKTALGAESMVPFEHYESLDDWLKSNSDRSVPLPIYALEQAPEATPIHKTEPPKSFAILLGEEVNGIHPEYLCVVDEIIEIPMTGNKESFNVSVACGIALYALILNRNALPTDNAN